MRVKQIAGKVYGADLTKKEQQAMEMEIRKQIAEDNEKNANEIDALILWLLYEEFDFTEEQLKHFHDSFFPAVKELTERYELPGSDTPWLCTKKLLDHGIDISKWNAETSNRE